MSKKIFTKNAPDAIGPYSQAVVSGPFVFTSGQIAIHPTSGEVEEAGIEGQTEQVLRNLGEVLKAAGASYTDVVKTTCFLQNMDDFTAFNEVYARYFPGKPARSCVAAQKLPKGVLVEIEAIAEISRP